MRKLALVLVLSLLALPIVGTATVDTAEAACPYGGPYCYEHDDCDDWCGSPDFGYCEFQHWSGCCSCLG
jgi:hypothetical protein